MTKHGTLWLAGVAGAALALAGAARAPAATLDDMESDRIRTSPLGATMALDESGARFGFESRLRWAPGGEAMRTDGRDRRAPRAPFAIEGRAHAVDWRSGERPMLGTAALLSTGGDTQRLWLGLAARERRAAANPAGRWAAGAGVARIFRSVTAHADVYSMRGYIEGDVYRSVLGVPGFPDSTMLGPPQRQPAREPLWTTGLLTMRWQRGPGAIEAAGGVALGRLMTPRRWARLAGRVQISSGVAFEVAYGQRAPAAAAFDPSIAPGSAIAFTWTPARRGPALVPPTPVRTREWQLARIEADRFAIHLRCPHARRLELRGDFSDWEPVRMRGVGGGWWEWVAPLQAGLQKVQVRIDGGPWSAPDGLPLQRDGDRESGTIVVPEDPRGE